MRRADRLFRIVQILRDGRIRTARQLAERLEVSERTIYRDVSDLSVSGVPIESEAGVGYRLRDYELPPLAFSRAELEAVVLGARIVEGWADPELSLAAASALEKVDAVLPPASGDSVAGTMLFAPPGPTERVSGRWLPPLRRAIRASNKVRLRYRDSEDRRTRRVVRPLSLAFFGPVWVLAAWCELRDDFRSFRPDRIEGLEVLDETFEPEPGKTHEDFVARLERDRAAPSGSEDRGRS